MIDDKTVSKMARVLNDRTALECNVDADDQWKIYGQDFICEVREMIAVIPEPIKMTQAVIEMPERYKLEPYYQTVNTESKNWLAGWNACLDKFDNLNRSKT